MIGINLSGAEFGSVGGTYGVDYIYPSVDDINYYASKGMDVVRLPFLWERVQPTEDGPLDTAELARIDQVVDYATSKGLKVVLDVHNYGSAYGSLVGSAALPNTSFADLWGKLATHFIGNANVMFGLMNEPHDQTPTQWIDSANAAIGAIRSAGATQTVLVPGTSWDGAWSWVSSGNSTVVGGGVVDPLHNFLFEVHQYLDLDSSGTSPSVVSPTIGVERLTEITNWARSTGNKLFLGEFGAAQDIASLTALDNMMAYVHQNADVWSGATYWSGGPWWGDYMFSIEPSNLANPVDTPQMGILVQYAHPTVLAQPMLLTSLSETVLLPSGDAMHSGPELTLPATDGIATLAGTADPNATVHFTIDGAPIAATATAGADGSWSFTPTGLSDGFHTVVASVTNAAGETEAATIDLVYNAHEPIPMFTGASLSNGEVTITGTTGEVGDIVSIYDGNSWSGFATTGDDGTFTYTTKATAGAHTYGANATGPAGEGHGIGKVILGSADTDTLVGPTGNNVVVSHGSNNIIMSGPGADKLIAGDGNVTFKYTAATESTAAAPDIINDFRHGADKIDFTAIAGINASNGVPTFQGYLSSTGNATLNAHSVAVMEVGGSTQVLVNTSNAAETVTPADTHAADMKITLLGVNLGITGTDFHHS